MSGITTRHRRGCASRGDGKCDCKPSYQAHVWSARDGKRLRKTFPTLAAAKAWRRDALTELARGTLRAPTPQTLREAAEAWLEGAKAGTIRTRSGDCFKPSTLRGYEDALRVRILPLLGGARLSDVRRSDLQDIADRMLAAGSDPSTIRNALMPLRAIYRRVTSRGDVAVNPTSGLELPAVRGRRDRIASPDEAERLLAALPEGDRAVWATALFAGLRRGELMGLSWPHVDLGAGVIRVEDSWDARSRSFVGPKSRAGTRTVPIPAVLRDYLIEHKLCVGRTDGLVFTGRTPDTAFEPGGLAERARRAWKAAGVEPITLHEARHTFASLMIAAGVNAKALATYMGHASVTITYDRYGHLMPGNEDEAAALLNAYLERANTKARLAQIQDSAE